MVASVNASSAAAEACDLAVRVHMHVCEVRRRGKEGCMQLVQKRVRVRRGGGFELVMTNHKEERRKHPLAQLAFEHVCMQVRAGVEVEVVACESVVCVRVCREGDGATMGLKMMECVRMMRTMNEKEGR